MTDVMKTISAHAHCTLYLQGLSTLFVRIFFHNAVHVDLKPNLLIIISACNQLARGKQSPIDFSK